MLVRTPQLRKFYVNGDLEGSGVGTDSSGFTLDYIGCDDSLSNFYEGELREFFVFADTLVSVQVGELNSYLYRSIQEQDFYWTPDSLPNLAAWYEAVDDDSVLVKAASPGYFDGDFETVGLAPWSNVAPGVGTKVAGAPGGSGSQVLRVTNTGGINGQVRQISGVGITGNRYNVAFWCRGDGTTYPDVLVSTLSPILGTSSYTWQYVTGEVTANWAGCSCRSNGADGGWCEFDDIVLTNLSRTQWNPKSGNLGGYLSQATAAAQPWWDGSSVYFDLNDALTHNITTAQAKIFHDATSLTQYFVVKPSTFAAFNVIQATAASTNQIGAQTYWDVNGAITSIIYNGTPAVPVYTCTSANGIITTNVTLITVIKTYAGLIIRVNGTQVADDSTISGSLSSANATSAPFIGAQPSLSYSANASLKEYIIDLSINNISTIENYLAAKHSITLP